MVKNGGKITPVMEPIVEEEDTSALLQFSKDDIKSEVDFWNLSVCCYILGANPPWEVVEGYVYRVWSQFDIYRVSFMDNGVFLVRFKTLAKKQALLESGYYLFDNKPIIIKSWESELDLVKGKVDIVPIWIRLYGIPLKFWGECLPKIAGLVGTYVKKDEATAEKTRLSYARVMVEVGMDQKLLDHVCFLDEAGQKVKVKVEYEWKPITLHL
ncbi:uncharacterized protein LOC141601604 [Silene latifolia]|uniref:uncharacterized protein LOC141601604 n=1 Tax=Silene latifolia TaxID=37657 RepID=UPI003D7732A0